MDDKYTSRMMFLKQVAAGLIVSVRLVALSFLLLPFIGEAIAATTPVSVSITKVKCLAPCQNEGLEAAGESMPDFYARIWINGRETTTGVFKVNQDQITPDWKVPADIPTTQSSFFVSIQIWDEDDSSGHDLADASPVRGKDNLEFTVDRMTGKWSGDVTWPNKCPQGGHRKYRVEVCFEVGGFEDSDGDGLLDDWEKNGLDADSDGTIDVNLPAMGANYRHKDIFLELDWMTGQAPTRQAIQALKAAFKAAPINAGDINIPPAQPPKHIDNPDGQPGITLWVDTGSLTDSTGSLVGDNLGGGNAVPVSNISGLTSRFYDVKKINFNPKRSSVFHYALSAANPTNNTGTSTGRNTSITLKDTSQTWIKDEWKNRTVTITSGTGAGQPAQTIVSNTANELSISTPFDPFGTGSTWAILPDNTSRYTISLTGGEGERGGNDFIDYNHDPGTIMHELGHNLYLDHGGNDPINCKPNYVSVMNYDYQFGIQQNPGSTQGADFDGNGTLEIIDYSPPQFPRGRGSAPLPQLVENNLNEATILDSTDAANQLIYTRGAMGKFSSPLNQRVDWNGDGDTNDSGLTLNLNRAGRNGFPGDCAPNTLSNETLSGFNDWDNVVLNFTQFSDSKDAPINVVNEPEPTLEDHRLLQEELNTTDLEIIKRDSPKMAVAGQELVYTLTVTNHGPRLARTVQVVDILPKQVTHTSNTGGCVVGPSDRLTCNLGEFRVGESREIQIRVHVATDLPCKGDDQFFTLTNNARVVNLSGPDSNPSNNEVSEHTQVLCIKYEYAAKVVCGKQKNPENLSVAGGLYATSINIHNPNDEKVYFFKKLALTYPPEEQKPGRVMPIAIDTLEYDEALKSDCVDIEKNLFKGDLPTSYIEGFIIIQSPRSLDVTGVYSTASIHNSIHIEQIRERQRTKASTKTIEKRPDLVVSKIDKLNVDCPNGPGTCVTEVRVTISNVGTAAAPAFNTRVILDPAQSITVNQSFPGGLAAGASQSFTVKSPHGGNCFDPDCTVCVTVDSEEEVLESDETNNELCETKAG